jgi:hypothetical protein
LKWLETLSRVGILKSFNGHPTGVEHDEVFSLFQAYTGIYSLASCSKGKIQVLVGLVSNVLEEIVFVPTESNSIPRHSWVLYSPNLAH